jgi:anti-sigma factor RsiW
MFMVGCEFNAMLGRYHDGELPIGKRAQFEQHLPACADCSAELEQMQSISQTLRAGIRPRASADFLSRLESLASNVEDVMIMRFVRRLTAAAAAILVGATLLWALHSAAPTPTIAVGPTPSTDERILIDPETAANTAANNAMPDNNLAPADAQFGALASDIAGGRP